MVGDTDGDVENYREESVDNQDPPVKAAVVGVVALADGENPPRMTREGRMFGFLAGNDPVFGQHAGVYGQSDQQGVTGFGAREGTGVFGAGNFGVRGESTNGTAAIQGRSFGTALAGKFVGNVDVAGAVHVSGDHSVDGDVKVLGDVILQNRDICERFPVESPAAKGSVW